MAKEDLVLKFEIEPGEVPDAEKVARALLAYIDMLKAANAALDPTVQLEIGLVGVEDGSDVFRLSLRRLEDFASELKAGMDEYPLVSKAAVALAGVIGATVVGVAVTAAIAPDSRIPDDQMEVFEEHRRLMSESVELQREQNRFFGILYEERAISRIDVMRGGDRQVVYSVPKEEFAPRSGLWSGEETGESHLFETRTATWDVILIKPVLVAEARRWQFARDGLEFSARMEDTHFLQAIKDKTLTVPLSEGIRMRIEVKYREQFDGAAWLPVRGSHRVSQVLDPLPPPPNSPLFPRPNTP